MKTIMEKPTHRWEKNIKSCVKMAKCENVDRFHLTWWIAQIIFTCVQMQYVLCGKKCTSAVLKKMLLFTDLQTIEYGMMQGCLWFVSSVMCAFIGEVHTSQI
jgi:hypothetical protein